MRIIKASSELLPVCEVGEETKRIELIAGTCYKSEDKICEGSDLKMVQKLRESKHFAMFEHVSIAFIMDLGTYDLLMDRKFWLEQHFDRTYFLRVTSSNGRNIISANLRGWLEYLQDALGHKLLFPNSFLRRFSQISSVFNLEDFNDIEFCVFKKSHDSCEEIRSENMTAEERLVHCDRTVKFICDRGVSHELVRHRVASFAQESTCYANYSKDRFGSQITVIQPLFYSNVLREDAVSTLWRESCEKAEECYMKMLDKGLSPQEARSVLPNSLKTEIYMTANLGEWKHFFDLRYLGTTGAPHPQMLEVTTPLFEQFCTSEPNIFPVD